MKAKKFYLAGPMTGVPQFNYPAFDAACEALRARGVDVVSPAELDDLATRAEALASPDGKLVDGKSAGHTWGDFLSRDVKIVADECTGIILMPGWEKSRGAKLEAYVGLLCGHEFHEYVGDGFTSPIPASHVSLMVWENTRTWE